MRILDPGSGMERIRIRNPDGKIRIRDKHPGVATLTVGVIVLNDKILKYIFVCFRLGSPFLFLLGSLNLILAKLSFGI